MLWDGLGRQDGGPGQGEVIPTGVGSGARPVLMPLCYFADCQTAMRGGGGGRKNATKSRLVEGTVQQQYTTMTTTTTTRNN